MITLYITDSNYVYAGSVEADPMDALPRNSTLTPPPLTTGTEVAQWLGEWVVLPEYPSPQQEPASIPQEVTMGQCRLALFDLHGIKTDQAFYALADVLPEELRPRARLQLSTRQSVHYDNELVIAFCEANDWDRDALFIYANDQ